ncbi:transposon-encoded TnpW family protein [Desulfoscipio gibsoniae]
MEVHIKIYGRTISVQAFAEVGEFLDRARHKSKNLAHEKRRHWDNHEFDETIVAHECSGSYYETPEDWLCRSETLREIMAVLVTIHFSATSRETMSDKIKRMLRNEVNRM